MQTHTLLHISKSTLLLFRVSKDQILNTHRMARRQTIAIGLWGGEGGISWDDGSYHGIHQIKLSHGEAIGSIQVIYDMNGQRVPGEVHGMIHDNFANEEINFEEGEYIQNVRGHIDKSPLAQRTPVIRSLTFKTNRRQLGPYGTAGEKSFEFPIDKGLIVGFKGASGGLLDAIGFHVSL